MSFNPLANPRCSIDIYPFEGDPYLLTSDNGQILSLSTRKNIRENAGTFTVILAPGGPNGTEAPPSWTEVLTPMSFCIIAMERGDEAAITMLGVINTATESQQWQPDGSVIRTIIVSGQDFGYFFSMFSYYSLWFLGANGAQLQNLVPQPSDGLPTLLGAGLIQGQPSLVGSAWYNTIMAGASGMLAHTFLPYQGRNVTFSESMATLFDSYPAYILPYGDSFIGYEGAWIDKFKQIFAFPWYEFFIETAPPNFYNVAAPSGSTAAFTSGYAFSSSLLGPAITASPVLVARINPMPRLTTSNVGANGAGTFDGIDISGWNGLPLFQPDSNDPQNIFPFIDSTISFSESEVLNTFLINPTWFRALFGGAGLGGNSNISPLLLNFAAAGDVASIHRYGFRIGNGTLSWFTDLEGDTSATNQANIASLMADIIGRYSSFYEPLGLMGRASVTMPLRPDIIAGCRFRYRPLKNEPTYDFYIEGVEHTFNFGGPSTSSLMLSRGLPTSVYTDSSTSGILYNALKGNAQRKNGLYTIGVPAGLGSTLQAISPTQMQTWLGQVASIYTMAQAVSGS